jgi:hypothetical protein
VTRRVRHTFWLATRAFFVTALVVNAGDERTLADNPRLWIRDRVALEREVDALIRTILPADTGASGSTALLDALLLTGIVETQAPTGVDPDDDLALVGSSAALSAFVASARTRLTGEVADIRPSKSPDVLRRTLDTIKGLVRSNAQPSVTLTARGDGSTIRFRRSAGGHKALPTPLRAWSVLPSDAVFAGAARLEPDGAGVLESWITALTGAPAAGITLPTDAKQEVAVAARFDRSAIPDLLFVVPSPGERRDAVLRALMRTAIATFAPNLPMSAVKTEKRRVLRWVDANGWTFTVQPNVPDVPARLGIWHANDGDSLLVAIGERPDALDWCLGAIRRHQTLGDLSDSAVAPHDVVWWFSPTAMLRETARLCGATSPACRTLSRLLERLPSTPSVIGSRDHDSAVDAVTFDVREWASLLSALDAVSDLNAP